MLRLENAQADIKSFTITLNHSAGTKRGLGRGSFVSSVTSLVDQFYVDVLQYLKNWAAAAPRPKDSPPGAAQEVDPPVSTDIQTSQASDRDVLARQTCSEGRAAGSLNLAHSWMTTDGHRRSIVIAVVEWVCRIVRRVLRNDKNGQDDGQKHHYENDPKQPPVPQVVEVLGRYSNHRDQVERIRNLLESGPLNRSEAKSRTSKQVQRRLHPSQIDQLVDQYLAGDTIQALAAQFQLHRFTVSRILDRCRVPRHPRGIHQQRLPEVARRYEAGDSLATIAKYESVSPETIRLALQKAGFDLRRRKGWTWPSGLSNSHGSI